MMKALSDAIAGIGFMLGVLFIGLVFAILLTAMLTTR